MNFKCVSNLNSALLLFLLVAKTSLGQECDSDGIKCISCNDCQTCNAGLPEGIAISCKNGKCCTDDQLRQCQKKLSCFALTDCTQNGIFPDPMDETHFVVCLGDASSGFFKYEFMCPDGNFFDVTTQACVPKAATAEATTIPTETTTSPPETTTTPIETTTTPPETTTTPIETTTTPTEITTTSTETTTTPTESSTALTTTEATSSGPTSPDIKPTTTSKPPAFVCPGPGTFPNTGNCKMYYRCSSTLKAFFYICPGKSYFNENILKCSLNITQACQEQISKNSTTATLPPAINTTPTTLKTTTKAPLTSSTTTSTTTTKPTTTSTSATKPTTPTATVPAPSTPNPCLSGGTFPHPTDCKTYYRCSVSGKAFLYICPGKTFFNEFTKRCSLTMTARCKALVQG